MSLKWIVRIAASGGAMVGLALWLPGCPGTPASCGCPSGGYDPIIIPSEFVAVIDNPFFPLIPGTTFVYETETDEGTERVEVTVTENTVEILGVTCTVVHDTVTLEGEFVEDTYDWYAQDVDGNVWYFGEASNEYEDGMIRSTFGSWESGVHCAKPGIIMRAAPEVSDTYRQEFYACVAEDMATILALDASVTVPHGTFEDCLQTEDFTPLDPEVLENKFYAAGVGLVLTTDGDQREELISVTTK